MTWIAEMTRSAETWSPHAPDDRVAAIVAKSRRRRRRRQVMAVSACVCACLFALALSHVSVTHGVQGDQQSSTFDASAMVAPEGSTVKAEIGSTVDPGPSAKPIERKVAPTPPPASDDAPERELEPVLDPPPVMEPETEPGSMARPRPASRPRTETPAPSAKELFAAAQAARKKGDAAAARAALLEIRRQHPDSPLVGRATFLLGRVELELGGDPAEANVWFERYVDEHPSGPLAGAARGRLLERAAATQAPEARALAASYLEHHPDGHYAALAERLAAP